MYGKRWRTIRPGCVPWETTVFPAEASEGGLPGNPQVTAEWTVLNVVLVKRTIISTRRKLRPVDFSPSCFAAGIGIARAEARAISDPFLEIGVFQFQRIAQQVAKRAGPCARRRSPIEYFAEQDRVFDQKSTAFKFRGVRSIISRHRGTRAQIVRFPDLFQYSGIVAAFRVAKRLDSCAELILE